MLINLLKKLLFISILLISIQPLYGENIKYCWDDENGNLACGDLVPLKYSQNGYCLYKNGHKISCIKPAPTAEEVVKIEIQRKIKHQCKKQHKKDEALLALFSTERDIELARAAVLSSIDGQLQSLQTILDGIKGNLDDLLFSYKRSQNNDSVSKNQLEAIQKNIERVKKRIADNELTLQNKFKERENINKEYDSYVQQYQDIMQWRKNNTSCELKVKQIIEIINLLMRIDN